MTYYLHTLDGRPACFVPGQGICFIMKYDRNPIVATSLKQIRKEQRDDDKIRAHLCAGVPFKRGYVRICTPERSPA